MDGEQKMGSLYLCVVIKIIDLGLGIRTQAQTPLCLSLWLLCLVGREINDEAASWKKITTYFWCAQYNLTEIDFFFQNWTTQFQLNFCYFFYSQVSLPSFSNSRSSSEQAWWLCMKSMWAPSSKNEEALKLQATHGQLVGGDLKSSSSSFCRVCFLKAVIYCLISWSDFWTWSVWIFGFIFLKLNLNYKPNFDSFFFQQPTVDKLQLTWQKYSLSLHS